MGIRSATGKFQCKFTASLKNVLDDESQASCAIGEATPKDNLTDGLDTDQFNRALQYQATISSGNTLDIDVFDFGALDPGAGAGKDHLGQAWTAEEVVLFLLKHLEGAGSLEVRLTDPTNPLTWVRPMTVANGGALREGGVYAQYQPAAAGLNVTDAASHQIRLKATGGDVTFQLLLFARHDDDASSASSASSSSSSSRSSSSRSSSSLSSQSSLSSVSSSSKSSSSTS